MEETMQKDQRAKYDCLNNQCKEMTQGSDSILLLPALEDTCFQYIDCRIHIVPRGEKDVTNGRKEYLTVLITHGGGRKVQNSK